MILKLLSFFRTEACSNYFLVLPLMEMLRAHGVLGVVRHCPNLRADEVPAMHILATKYIVSNDTFLPADGSKMS